MFLSSSDLRVSDAEREDVAGFLKRHYAAGRLSEHELSTRIDAVYRARWDSQLVALTRDLPAFEVERPRRRKRHVGLMVWAVALLVAVTAFLAALPGDMAMLFVAITVPMLIMLVVMLAPFALLALGVAWATRALGRGKRRPYLMPPPHGRRHVRL